MQIEDVLELTVVPVCYIKQAIFHNLNSIFYPLNNAVHKSIHWGSAALVGFLILILFIEGPGLLFMKGKQV